MEIQYNNTKIRSLFDLYQALLTNYDFNLQQRKQMEAVSFFINHKTIKLMVKWTFICISIEKIKSVVFR